MVRLENIIKNLEDVDLSGMDILRISQYAVHIYTYEEILNFNTIEELLGPKKAAIILYQTKSNYGHWVLIMETTGENPTQPQNKHIEFFDPYAFNIDEELKFSNYNLKMHNGQIIPHLSLLVLKSGIPVKVNTYKLQKFAKHVNTCGRWCAVRALYRNIPLYQFVGMFTSNSCYDPDFWISTITLNS